MEKFNKLELIEYFLTKNKSGYKTKEKHISNKFPNLLEIINEYSILYFNTIDFPLTQKLYNFLYNIQKIPKCENCNNDIKWRGVFSEGYLKYCSKECKNKSRLRIERMNDTNFKKYGVKNVSERKDVIKMKKKNCIEKYGVDSIFNISEIKDKIKKTNLEKYGVEFPTQNKLIKDKIKKNNLEKYGVTYPSKLDKFKEINIIEYRKRFEEKIKSRGYVVKEYLKDNDILIIHPDGHLFEIKRSIANNRFNTNTELSTILLPIGGFKSTNEIEIKDFLKSINVMYEPSNKKILNGYEIDIYIPDYKLGIEMNGLYWHSDIFKDKNYHLNKTNVCEEQGIQLLHIFQNEWVFKQDVVKSIVKSKLGIYNEKIYARKCKIKEISDNNLVNNFLNDNHLQGFIGSNTKIGLFYNNELVSLMTFGKKRISMGNKTRNDNEYEMYRFCNKINTQVIGGASRLLKYFIKTYQPKSILTFADRRYSNGDLYRNLGFKFIGNTEPNYWYFEKNDKQLKLQYRFKFRKDVLVKEGYDFNKTEHEIMGERGYLKIFDCGNMKFEMKINK